MAFAASSLKTLIRPFVSLTNLGKPSCVIAFSAMAPMPSAWTKTMQPGKEKADAVASRNSLYLCLDFLTICINN
jgi:hypothetical protein